MVKTVHTNSRRHQTTNKMQSVQGGSEKTVWTSEYRNSRYLHGCKHIILRPECMLQYEQGSEAKLKNEHRWVNDNNATGSNYRQLNRDNMVQWRPTWNKVCVPKGQRQYECRRDEPNARKMQWSRLQYANSSLWRTSAYAPVESTIFKVNARQWSNNPNQLYIWMNLWPRK